MAVLVDAFEERLREIDTYLDLLEALDRQVQSGTPPEIGGAAITVQQQRILYSAVYLQLYNLVEATVTWCVDAICAAASKDGRWFPSDLSDGLRREWIRLTARTQVPMNEDNRLNYVFDTCEHIIKSLPITWPHDTGRKGNWDDDEIEGMSSRIGCELSISPAARTAAKRPIRDDKGPLRLIRDLRNRLAHGAISFEECGTNVTIGDLRDIKEKTVLYLRDVVAAYGAHVGEYKFLTHDKRPVPPA